MPTPGKFLLQAEEITIIRQGHTLVEGVDLSMAPGEIVTIVGPNGGGKTTLLQALLGLIPLTRGRVIRHPELRLGFVPQKLELSPALPMRVVDFLLLSAPRSHSGEMPPLSPELMERLSCHTLFAKPLLALSGGEMQRVLLARALCRNPNLLILDEPAQGVDASGVREIHALLEELRQQRGMASLLVSHDLYRVMAATDRVLCLNRHICCSGPPTSLGNDPAFLSLFGEKEGTLGFYRHHHDHQHRLL